jgi:hypothetical protein
MQNHQRESEPLEKADLLSDRELETVSGGEPVAHLPQSIHMDYSNPATGVTIFPTRYC